MNRIGCVMDKLTGYLIIILSVYILKIGATDKVCDGIKPCVSLSTANKGFEKCCNNKHLGDCSKHCRYDANLKELKAAIRNNECDLINIRNFLRCAANNKNNDACCKKTSVFIDGREICEPFCNPNSSNFPTSSKGIGKYLKCLGQFEQIMQCHYASCR